MPPTAPERERRWTDRVPRPPLGVLALAVVAYVPLLLTRPGQVGADTKSYLYLDPGRLLSRAAHMWDPNVGLGTVTHQNIGYLWPMGPYYWLMEALSVPDWVAQRLWLGTIILMAGLGVRFMLKELRWVGAGVTVASFSYALSPYLLDYAARISVILLPFAGLPWLVGLAARSLRRDDWRSPAWFALVTLTVGGVNATSLILVMVGPLLWFVHAVFVEREVTLRRAIVVGLRITALTAVTSLWWVAGLSLQGAFGIPILRYTETYETVANASMSTELMRGLGYWFFYGTDGLGAWTESSLTLVENLPALALSFLLPLLAVTAVLLTRWRHRVFFAAIVLAGLVIGVGAHPWDGSSPYGSLFRAFTGSDLGLSFRSTPRAVPLIALGLAVFLGAGLASVTRVRPQWHKVLSLTLLVLICANLMPLFRGQMVDRNLLRDSEVPGYWQDAAARLDEQDPTTRVWELPGIDFAAYRWGNTVDPITPGLMDREMVARELIPYGTPPSANLVNDVDLPFQAARVEPDAVAPLARLMGVGDLLLRSDLQYERYRAPRPRLVYSQLLAASGLGEPIRFGEPVPNVAGDALPLDDEMEYSIPLDAPDPAPVTIFPVLEPRPMLRTVSAASPTLLAGDAAGLVSLASIGALAADRPVFYSASYADDPDGLVAQADEPQARLVVTDTNRRQARRWGTVRENDGYTEREGELALVEDRTDNRLEVFEDADDDHRTVTEQLGGATVAASAYGNGVTYTAGDRPVKALDQDPATAWRVAAFDDPVGEFIRIDLDEPVTADRISLLQLQGLVNRSITRVLVTLDGGDPIEVELTESSRIGEGQVVEFPEQSFDRVEVTIAATDRDGLASYRGASGVGFSEISIPGLGPISEVIRPPVDLLDTVGAASLDRDLMYVFSRRAAAAADVLIADEEPVLSRWVIGPEDRTFTVFGRARLSADLPEERIDAFLGIPSADEGGVTATSSARLPGDLASRASAAVDGDTTTAFRTPFNGIVGTALEFTYPEPVTVDDLQLRVVADGRHSLPTAVSLSVDGGPSEQFQLEPLPLGEGEPRGTVATLTVPTGERTGTTFRLSIDAVNEAESEDWFGRSRIVLPLAIAEVGLPTVAVPSSARLDERCRDDLITLDGAPVPVAVRGTVGAAAAGDSVELVGCGDAADGVEIAAGRQLLATAPGAEVDLDVDLLALSSVAGGAAGPDTLVEPTSDGPTPPSTETRRTGRNDYEVDVSGADEPYWVVLGQSFGDGWSATTTEGDDLGEPTLVNGYANGWRIDPAELGADVTVQLRWTPQRLVWVGLGASVLGVLLCLGLALWPRRGRAEDAPTLVTGGPMEPVLHRPDSVDGPALAPVRAAVVGLVAGVVGAVFVGWVAGLAVALLVGVSLVWNRGQLVLRVAAVGLLGAAFGYVVLKQARNDYPLDFDWMEWFQITHQWTLTAVVLMSASVVVDSLRRNGD